ncbi:MAG: hypothetical protein U5O39_07705 [Gammaproteobacteria bacterium]|nr:hypothetical protein [Gammaproteobacteria bacterium]
MPCDDGEGIDGLELGDDEGDDEGDGIDGLERERASMDWTADLHWSSAMTATMMAASGRVASAAVPTVASSCSRRPGARRRPS